MGKRSMTLTACLPPCRGPVPPAPAGHSSTPGQLHAHDGAGLLRRQRRRLWDHHRCPLLSAFRFAALFLYPSPLLPQKGAQCPWTKHLPAEAAESWSLLRSLRWQGPGAAGGSRAFIEQPCTEEINAALNWG